MNELKNYKDYKETVLEVISCLEKITEINDSLGLEKNNETIKEAIIRLKDDSFNIVIVGEFNRGKSSLINALLGKKNVLPVSIMPCTASINKVSYGPVPNAEVLYKDGTSEILDLKDGSDILKQYLTKLTEESSAKADSINEVLINYPIDYCRNGVTIIDTPGLNDDTSMTDITLSVLPKSDVAIMVLMAKAPYSQTENDFLESKILAGDLGKVMFVVNGIDQVSSEEDKQRIIDAIKDRISEASMQKVKSVYGDNSKEVEEYKTKLGDIKIFGLSARNAVKAKEEKNAVLLEQSKFPEFEMALEKFIVEQRGMISLLNPINKIKTSSIEIMRSCAERQSAIEMDLSEFVARCNKAEQEINELRRRQTVELSRISDSAQVTYQSLTPEINNFWNAIKNEVNHVIDTYPIDNEDLKKEKIKDTQKRIISEVRKSIEQTTQRKSEYIKGYIEKDLQAETDRLSGFEKEFFEGIERIQNCIIPSDSLVVNDEKEGVISTGVISFFVGAGIGGIYQGFKKAGWKGALVGGIGGFAGGFAGAVLIASLFTVATPVLAIVAALAGTISGKWLLSVFFPTDKTEAFKNAIRNSVDEELKKLQKQNDFSVKVKEQVDSMFNSLKEKVRIETDTILSDTQSRLSELREDLTENRINKTTEIERLEKIIKELSLISSRVERIDDKLKMISSMKYNQGV